MGFRHVLLLGAAMAPGIATAQTATPAPAAQADAVDDSGIGEIVVTAQRRSENLQNVPISVAALTQQQLTSAGISAVQDLTAATPGFVWARTTSTNQPTVRGIGTRNFAAGDEPNVATYFDGVYQPDSFGAVYELANVERVELLKGPQVTLFGRNATGGAVNIVTKKPSFTTEGEGSISYGRFDYLHGTAYISGPIVDDKLAVSLSGVAEDNGGYIRDIFRNVDMGKRKIGALRGKMLFQPSEGVEFQLGGFYSYTKDDTTFATHPLNGNSNVRTLVNNPARNPLNLPLSTVIPTGDFQTALDFKPFLRVKQYMIDGHMSVDLGFATLTGVAAYQNTDNDYAQDFDYSPLNVTRITINWVGHSTYQDLLLTSNGEGRFKWMVGGNALQAYAAQDPQNTNGNMTIDSQKTRSISGFVEGTYELVDHLFLTGGARYTRDKKTALYIPPASDPNQNRAGSSTTFNNLSPRAVARYEFARNSNVYASYSRGFKSGTYNPLTRNGALIPASPEKIEAFEGGIKTNLGSNVRFNAAAFHYNYTNLQVTQFGTINGVTVSFLQNAGKAKIDGAEASLEVKFNQHFRMSASAARLKTKITDFPGAAVTIPNPAVPPMSGNITTPINVSGKDLPRAPHWTGNIAANYTTDLGGGKLDVDASVYLTSRWYVDVLNRVAAPGYALANGSISWTTPDEHWRLSVFGKNLFNERYFATLLTFGGTDQFAYDKPRWFGGTVAYKF
ncbi:TonB-dependent receptor [Sphingomonas montanisoli]|uniref:TonB-dependent receptor n=1 Tax=Sphingomonas montanisoli TaxID=2606412 RepID=A0A5D9C2Q8_9SPHN|nr:TonB-dependent receptor [Sphingomonas montanisoli]TZG25866.1 TonB-dependent receptor [Sphingomonas montanisoli]